MSEQSPNERPIFRRKPVTVVSRRVASGRARELAEEIFAIREFLKHRGIELDGWPDASAALDNLRAAASIETRYISHHQPKVIIHNSIAEAKDRLVEIREDLATACRERDINPEPITRWIQRVADFQGKPTSKAQEGPAGDTDYKSAKWFEKNTTVTGDSLRKAVSSGKFLRMWGPDKKRRYSLNDAKEIWGNDILTSKRETP